MRILFGPAHDGLHISPDTPGAYEWWYFDALSDDGRFALVAIFFLGTPMSPYYKAVVDGKNPLPKDWCGVFFSLHERVEVRGRRRWAERAYAYNLYRDGEFADEPLDVQIGNSRLRQVISSDGKQAWHLQIEERGLWRHTLKADLHFVLDVTPLSLTEQGDHDNAHTWACVAPTCQLIGTVTLPGGDVPLCSRAYHDHNFGQLPWDDTDVWYWANVSLWSGRPFDPLFDEDLDPAEYKTVHLGTGILYRLEGSSGRQDLVLFFDKEGNLSSNFELRKYSQGDESSFAYGFKHKTQLLYSLIVEGRLQNHLRWGFDTNLGTRRHGAGTFVYGSILEGPFYRRLLAEVGTDYPIYQYPEIPGEFHGWGIGEVFRPARLCGPIASRAVWTRMRRRS